MLRRKGGPGGIRAKRLAHLCLAKEGGELTQGGFLMKKLLSILLGLLAIVLASGAGFHWR